MQANTAPYEQYNASHHNFIMAYKIINEYVAELYKLPKRLVEDAGQALDNFCCEDQKPAANYKIKKSCRVIIDFMDQLDVFTVHTIGLFNEHKKHVDQTRVYIRKISALKMKYNGSHTEKEMEEYARLAPELNKLLEGLRNIKQKADDMITRLEKLELRWENIKVKMN